MSSLQFCALLLLLQGVVPALAFHGGPRGSEFVLAVSVALVLAAWGLWHRRRWGWWLACGLTSLQALGISSALLTWQLLLGLGYEMGVAWGDSPLELRLVAAGAWGVGGHFGLLHPGPALPPAGGFYAHGFVFVNLVAVALLWLLGSVRGEFSSRPPTV